MSGKVVAKKAKLGADKKADKEKKPKKDAAPKPADTSSAEAKSSGAAAPTSPSTPVAPIYNNSTSQAASNHFDIPDVGMLPFEAGQIFSKFDHDGDGKLNKHEFTELVRHNPDLLRALPLSKKSAVPPFGGLPTELITNRVLTHFDETAGVAIPRHEVEQHIRMGNVVAPLTEAYKTRYERLRAVMTGKLLPKREHLLQLRRQLQHTSTDVDAKRRNIERETLSDTEQILERLRAVESMRQSSIRHQILQLEEELQSIERIVRRVERANIEEGTVDTYPAGGILLTSAAPSSGTIEPIRAPRATAMVEIIHEFGDLMSIMEQVSHKPIAVQTEFPTDDFPRETAERMEIIGRCDKYAHAINVKDHMLWTMLQEKEKLEQSLMEEKRLSQEYAQEITHWAEMAQQLNLQLTEYKQDKEALQRRAQHLLMVLRNHNIHYEG